jgi:hypothetical protein
MKFLLNTPSVWSDQTTDQMRVPTQQVLDSWSDRWIVVKILQEFPKGYFVGMAMKELREAPNVWSGKTTDLSKVPAQKVHNPWSDRWIVLKFLI